MINAAGAIFVSLESERILLNFRSKEVKFPSCWGFFGGKINKDEKILKGLSREIREEIGFIPKYKKVLPLDIHKTIKSDFTYYTFGIFVNKEFLPIINNESNGFGWFNINGLPYPLHPGVKAIIHDSNFKSNFEKLIRNNLN